MALCDRVWDWELDFCDKPTGDFLKNILTRRTEWLDVVLAAQTMLDITDSRTMRHTASTTITTPEEVKQLTQIALEAVSSSGVRFDMMNEFRHNSQRTQHLYEASLNELCRMLTESMNAQERSPNSKCERHYQEFYLFFFGRLGSVTAPIV